MYVLLVLCRIIVIVWNVLVHSWDGGNEAPRHRPFLSIIFSLSSSQSWSCEQPTHAREGERRFFLFFFSPPPSRPTPSSWGPASIRLVMTGSSEFCAFARLIKILGLRLGK